VSERDLEHELAPLRRSYRGKLPSKLDQLDALLGEARGSPQAESLRAALDLAHTLKGTSGSYGLDEFSAELQIVENCLDRLREGADGAGDADWGEIDAALARARKACSRDDSGCSPGPA
jgi:hypothetical protein